MRLMGGEVEHYFIAVKIRGFVLRRRNGPWARCAVVPARCRAAARGAEQTKNATERFRGGISTKCIRD
jgi:hypothetical protein